MARPAKFTHFLALKFANAPAIASEQQRIIRSHPFPGLLPSSLTPLGKLHLTLCLFRLPLSGDIPVSVQETIREASRPTVTLGTVGVFGDPGHARVLYFTPNDDSALQSISSLSRKLVNRLAEGCNK